MRISIASILLAGGLLALGACSTSEPEAMASADRRCAGRAEAVPTGRQTGDVRQDYRCRSIHTAAAYRPNGARNAAIDRALSGR